MTGYISDIKKLTEENTAFRYVVFTGPHLQLVLMALKPGADTGLETHAAHDQFCRIEKGRAEVDINGSRHKVKSGDAILVPAGSRHNLTNIGNKTLRLYTLYGLPTHKDGLLEQD